MTQLWPRLSPAVAAATFADISRRPIAELATGSANEHAQATYAATGGARVTSTTVGDLSGALHQTAMEFRYPSPVGDAERVAFDRAAAEVLFSSMDLTTVEAANREVWNFLALVVKPDLTQWRFGAGNRERWVATDLTRHMFARLWWQALTFAEPQLDGGFDYSLLRALSESDLNQITERRSLAGNPTLARAIGRLVIETQSGGRRAMLRDITPRLRRRLAFIDFGMLSDEQLEDHIRALV